MWLLMQQPFIILEPCEHNEDELEMTIRRNCRCSGVKEDAREILEFLFVKHSQKVIDGFDHMSEARQ